MPLSAQERRLRYAAVIFAVALAVHGADHAHRGFDVVSDQIMWAGNTQIVLALIALGLVAVRHRWAPYAAIVVGFASALGFTAAHLFPSWGVFSDSFLTPAADAGVTWYSWVSAVAEIGADLLFGWAGVDVLRHARAGATQSSA
ncbi:MAG: hypothetical protein ACRDT6_28890 [Micromonosporaceae bacterium]